MERLSLERTGGGPGGREWRTLPLLAGLAELGFWAIHGHPASTLRQILAFASSFALIIAGLVIAGPWLTMAAARGMARWTSRPGTLIAARRIADDPRAAFRAVSGLVLALFITTVAVVAITTQNAKNLTRWGSAAAAGVLTGQMAGQQPQGWRSRGRCSAPARSALARFRRARSPARSSRPCPPLAAARPGRQWWHSRKTCPVSC